MHFKYNLKNKISINKYIDKFIDDKYHQIFLKDIKNKKNINLTNIGAKNGRNINLTKLK